MHYYQFNIGDYASHTNHLDPIEDIAYRRMLDWCYTHEKPLPQDVGEIARLIRMRDNAPAIRDVLNEFFEQVEGGWFSARVQREIENFRTKIQQASKAGKASAERRLSARSTGVELTNNHKPITDNNKPKKESAVAPPSDVDEQVWKDWLTLRKAKKAPVTETVVTNARKEAEKAGVTFQHFLMIWCARGSQGLQADWLKPAERGQSNAVSFAQQERELGWKRWEEMTGREHPDRLAHEGKQAHQFIDVQATDILEIGK